MPRSTPWRSVTPRARSTRRTLPTNWRRGSTSSSAIRRDHSANPAGSAPAFRAGDVEAIYVGREQDWANEIGNAAHIPWWAHGYDFGIKVVSGAACVNSAVHGQRAAHHRARLIAPAARGVAGAARPRLAPLHAQRRERLSRRSGSTGTRGTRSAPTSIASGRARSIICMPGIAGGTSNLGWSDR